MKLEETVKVYKESRRRFKRPVHKAWLAITSTGSLMYELNGHEDSYRLTLEDGLADDWELEPRKLLISEDNIEDIVHEALVDFIERKKTNPKLDMLDLKRSIKNRIVKNSVDK